MTREIIEISFGNAMAQARELDACAKCMELLVKSSLGDIQNEMALTWQGNNANEYFNKLNITGDNILKTAKKLRDIAETLRRVARIFQETETRALEIARQRTYGS